MFFKLLSMLGLSNQAHRQAAAAARARFLANRAEEPIAWVEILEEEPARFIVSVYYGQRRPKQRQLYAVDKKTFTPIEIPDPRESGNGRHEPG